MNEWLFPAMMGLAGFVLGWLVATVQEHQERKRLREQDLQEYVASAFEAVDQLRAGKSGGAWRLVDE